jgi:hypothetical protein
MHTWYVPGTSEIVPLASMPFTDSEVPCMYGGMDVEHARARYVLHKVILLLSRMYS